jgi:hypothetical protein
VFLCGYNIFDVKPAPVHQRALLAVTAIVAGMLLFGSLLGALHNANAMLTPLAASILSAGIGLIWSGLEIIQRKSGVPWRLNDGTTARHRAFGWRTRGLFLGVMLLPWISHGVYFVAPKSPEGTPPPSQPNPVRHPFRFTYFRIGSAESLMSFLGNGTLPVEPVSNSFTVRDDVYNSLGRIRDRYLDRDVAVDCRASDYKSCIPRRTTLMALLLGVGYDRILGDLSGSGYTQLIGYHYKSDPQDYEYSSSLLSLPDYSLIRTYAEEGLQEPGLCTRRAFRTPAALG